VVDPSRAGDNSGFAPRPVFLYAPHVPDPISIIVPVFDEEDNVQPLADEVVRAFDGVNCDWGLVFVDDCSLDSTWDKIEAAGKANNRVRGFRLEKNSGQSAAVWTGIQGTDRALIATLDGDRQNDPADLPNLLKELESCDFACGWRHNRRDSFVRKMSSGLARWFRCRALKSDFKDTGCAVRLFKRECVGVLFGFNGLHRFMPILVEGAGFKCREVPVNHRPRVAGVSKYGVWNRLGRGIYDLIAISWYQKRRVNPVKFVESGKTDRPA
jgi:dolichol-phosphate mannosyltransferase